MRTLLVLFAISVIMTPGLLFGQPTDTARCQQLQLGDIFRKGKIPEVRVPVPMKAMFIIVPVISSNPATGFQLGAAIQQSIFLSDPLDTKISQASANITFTQKNQFLLTIKSFYITPHNKFIFQGDWRYLNYSQSTFGLGTNAPEGVSEGFVNGFWQDKFAPGEQPMLFKYIKFHETIGKMIKPSVYVGLGYHLDYHFDIADQNLTDTTLTSHYVYSELKGINPEYYTTSGVSLNIFYDSRDNQLNPYTGKYVNVQYRMNPTFLGSTASSSLLWAESRFYKNLSSSNPRHQIAWWSFANVVVSGKVPYLDLPGYGYDLRNRSGRSYIQGRFRGEDMLFSELEYRFPISRCTGILGGVLFVNATTLSNRTRNVGLFDHIRAGYGGGLRVMVDKVSRTNLLVDVGFGKDSFGITFGAAETF